MKTVAAQKQRIKKSTIEINGKKIPFYKIPTGMSGKDTIEDREDPLGDDPEEREVREQKMAIQTYLDTGVIEHSYVEDNIDILTPMVDEELFDKYE